MASETFVSAMMLITAVVASAILITAVFPIVWNMVSTFSSASHETDSRMRTDFKITTTYASQATGISKVWIKNIGTNPIGLSEIENADVFMGPQGNFDRLQWDTKPIDQVPAVPGINFWDGSLYDNNNNKLWDTGETLEIDGHSSKALLSGRYVYFQFVLPNGVFRSQEFTASD